MGQAKEQAKVAVDTVLPTGWAKTGHAFQLRQHNAT